MLVLTKEIQFYAQSGPGSLKNLSKMKFVVKHEHLSCENFIPWL